MIEQLWKRLHEQDAKTKESQLASAKQETQTDLHLIPLTELPARLQTNFERGLEEAAVRRRQAADDLNRLEPPPTVPPGGSNSPPTSSRASRRCSGSARRCASSPTHWTPRRRTTSTWASSSWWSSSSARLGHFPIYTSLTMPTLNQLIFYLFIIPAQTIDFSSTFVLL